VKPIDADTEENARVQIFINYILVAFLLFFFVVVAIAIGVVMICPVSVYFIFLE
jgi:hypothetical protein